MTDVSAADEAPWWKAGVLYQIYPRSFADSNGDGVGDLRGIIEHLDYLQWLGVDGIWLSPITVSPNRDWGYDVADYRAVQPDLGTDAEVDELIAEAAPARDPRAARLRAEPHERSAPVVRRRAIVANGAVTATGTSGPIPSPTARRRTTG